MRVPHKTRVLSLAVAFLLLSLTCAAQQKNVASTLDRKLAAFMAGKPGAVVVLDVASGKILAQWHLEVAAQRLEPPGSTVKPFVLKELLDLGRIQPEQRLLCRRPLYVGGRRMDCSHSPAVTTLNASDAIAYSCNSYFATVATRLSAAELESLLRQVGFSSPTGLSTKEIVGKIMPSAGGARLQQQALGEWGVEMTPLELLWAYRNLALQKLNNNIGADAVVFEGLEHSVQYGMAHAALPDGVTAAGKTGTAAQTHDPYTHGFFVGYAPADKPEIVLIVYLEHGRGSDAASIAAPVITSYWRVVHGEGK